MKYINKNDEYGIGTFVIVSCKENKGIFNGDYNPMLKLPDEVLFIKYEKFKETGFLEIEWIKLLDKGIINFSKKHYEWLLERCYTQREIEFANKKIFKNMECTLGRVLTDEEKKMIKY